MHSLVPFLFLLVTLAHTLLAVPTSPDAPDAPHATRSLEKAAYDSLSVFVNHNDYLMLDKEFGNELVLSFKKIPKDLIREEVKRARNTERRLFGSLPIEKLLVERLGLITRLDKETLEARVRDAKTKARAVCDKKGLLKNYNDAWRMDDRIAAYLLGCASVDPEEYNSGMRKKYARAVAAEEITHSYGTFDMELASRLGDDFVKMFRLREELFQARRSVRADAKNVDSELADALRFADFVITAANEYQIPDVIKRARTSNTFELAVEKRILPVVQDIVALAPESIPKQSFFKFHKLVDTLRDEQLLDMLNEHVYKKERDADQDETQMRKLQHNTEKESNRFFDVPSVVFPYRIHRKSFDINIFYME